MVRTSIFRSSSTRRVMAWLRRKREVGGCSGLSWPQARTASLIAAMPWRRKRPGLENAAATRLRVDIGEAALVAPITGGAYDRRGGDAEKAREHNGYGATRIPSFRLPGIFPGLSSRPVRYARASVVHPARRRDPGGA